MAVGVQRHAPAALPTGKRSGTHCIGGWVGPRAGLDGCGKSSPTRSGIWSPDRPISVRTSHVYCPSLIETASSAVVLRRAGHSVWTGLHDITFTSVQFPWRQSESDWLDHEVKAVENYGGLQCLTCDAGQYARCRHLPLHRYVSYSWKHTLSVVWFTFGVNGLLKLRLNSTSSLAIEDVRLFERWCCRVKERENVKFACVRTCVNFLVADKQFFHLQLIHVVNVPSKETRKQSKAVAYVLFNLS